jgi:predicted metal-binding protein
MTSSEFQQFKNGFSWAIVFKFEVPVATMAGGEQPELARMVHETATSIRDYLLEREDGALKAFAVAGGSCKKCFCGAFDHCSLVRDNQCRYPEKACPSMSALGVNSNALVKLLRWGGYAEHKPPEPMHELMGMVLFSP